MEEKEDDAGGEYFFDGNGSAEEPSEVREVQSASYKVILKLCSTTRARNYTACVHAPKT